MYRPIMAFSAASLLLAACGDGPHPAAEAPKADTATTDSFTWQTDQFADVRVLRYRIPGWERLSLQQKQLAYYLTMAGLSGRDIIWDQNYRYNLKIRRALEKIVSGYAGDKSSPDWQDLMLYAKQVFFHNGVHHHYSQDKVLPTFQRAWFEAVLTSVGATLAPEVLDAMFDPEIDAKKVCLDESKDLVLGSAVNFYGQDINRKEVEAFYDKIKVKGDSTPVSYGLNSKLVRGADGKLTEQVWKVGGMYGAALSEMVKWLRLAQSVAETPEQAHVIGLLVEFYTTGDLRKWDEFNLAWVEQKSVAVDFIQGFVEVYNDPLGKRGSFESSVEILDPEATGHMRTIQENAQWFEDHSPIMDAHKKKKVTGITYGFVNVAGEAGDAAPSTAIGVNLPNADWIRAKHGSKSVSFGNIIDAYDQSSGSGSLEEFCNDAEEIERAKKHGPLASSLHTALHEVIGHASGRIEPNVGAPDETLQSYASTLEEGRADLVALYYMMDPQLVQWGVMPSLEVGEAEYDGYIRNGLLVQLRRLQPGKDVEESHMRNRMWISKWCLEKGAKDSVIVVNVRDGRTYYDIRDYGKLRTLFGELLREVQRIKSQGDLKAARELVENYGVKVDPALFAEVIERSKKITTAPYAGFIQPELVPVLDANGKITDIKAEYPTDFMQQVLMYGRMFSFLPDEN
ncbi:MAG: dihydrofolate reductase [Flavobacteriales bacterium]